MRYSPAEKCYHSKEFGKYGATVQAAIQPFFKMS